MSQKNRLSPPLMFAFRNAHDSKDTKRSALKASGADESPRDPRRPGGRVAVTEALLRAEVSQDLEMLMNSIALESTQALYEFDDVRQSILNYGFPDLSHRTIDEDNVREVADEIKQSLERYEPRLDPGSIEVRRDELADKVALKLRFIVSAQLFCNPINVPVEFVADVDYDSGKIAVERI